MEIFQMGGYQINVTHKIKINELTKEEQSELENEYNSPSNQNDEIIENTKSEQNSSQSNAEHCKAEEQSESTTYSLPTNAEALTLLIRNLKLLELKMELTGAIIGWLRGRGQKIEMLAWIKENHERNPDKTEIVAVAHDISQEVTDQLTIPGLLREIDEEIKLKNKKILKEIRDLLIDGLIILNLNQKEIEGIISFMRKENQIREMLGWIVDNYEKQPTPAEVIEEAIEIVREIHD